MRFNHILAFVLTPLVAAEADMIEKARTLILSNKGKEKELNDARGSYSIVGLTIKILCDKKTNQESAIMQEEIEGVKLN
jgi:hypothetical protein